MLKRPIKYTDFDGNEVVEEFYFNLSKTDMTRMDVGMNGMGDYLQKLVDEGDGEKLIAEFEKIILSSYGIRSEDGKRFIKSDQISEEFSQTAAYDALFTELIEDPNAVPTFVLGIIPREYAEQAQKLTPQDKPVGPPPVQKAAPPLPPAQ